MAIKLYELIMNDKNIINWIKSEEKSYEQQDQLNKIDVFSLKRWDDELVWRVMVVSINDNE